MPYLSKLLAPDEDVLIHMQQHEIVLLAHMVTNIVLANIVVAHIWLSSTISGQSWLDLLIPVLPKNVTVLMHTILTYIGYGLLIALVYRACMDVAAWANNHYILTTRRVLHLSGIFNKNSLDSSLNKINDVQIGQSWFGRLLGYGTIEILTAADDADNKLTFMRDPMQFKQLLNEARHTVDEFGFMPEDTPDIEPTVASAAPLPSIVDAMTQLKALQQQGLITDDEFSTQRAALLGKLTT